MGFSLEIVADSLREDDFLHRTGKELTIFRLLTASLMSQPKRTHDLEAPRLVEEGRASIDDRGLAMLSFL